MPRHLTGLALLLTLCLSAPATLAAPPARPAPAATAPPATAPNTLTFTGKITTGIMAIGGETTGTTISDGKSTYELDIQDPVLIRKASELNGKQATVKGTLTLKAGIEIAQRRIISVTALDAAAPAAPATAPASAPAR